MNNLKKERILIYVYLSVVFTLIFGLSFTVQGKKITGSFVLESTNFLINKLNYNNAVLVLFVFFSVLAFLLFVFRYRQEIKKEIHHINKLFFTSIIVLLLVGAIFGVGSYFNKQEVTGAAVGLEKIAGFASYDLESLKTKLAGYAEAGALQEHYEEAKELAKIAGYNENQFDTAWVEIGGTVPQITVATADATTGEEEEEASPAPPPSLLDYGLYPGRYKNVKVTDDTGGEIEVEVDKTKFEVRYKNGDLVTDQILGTNAFAAAGVFPRIEVNGVEYFVDPRKGDVYYTKRINVDKIGPDGTKISGTDFRITTKLNIQKPDERLEILNALLGTNVGHIREDNNGNTYIEIPGNIFYKVSIIDGKIAVAVEKPLSPDKDKEILEDIKTKTNIQNIINRNARQLFSTMIHQLLDPYINEQLEAMCTVKEKSSEPVLSQSSTINPGPISPFNISDDQGNANNCADSNLTTITAQGRKTETGSGFSYELAWTVVACKENIGYTIYFSNETIDDASIDRTAIAGGTADLGEISSDSETIAITKSYNLICMQTSDTTIGNNGYACFELVEVDA